MVDSITHPEQTFKLAILCPVVSAIVVQESGYTKILRQNHIISDYRVIVFHEEAEQGIE